MPNIQNIFISLLTKNLTIMQNLIKNFMKKTSYFLFLAGLLFIGFTSCNPEEPTYNLNYTGQTYANCPGVPVCEPNGTNCVDGGASFQETNADLLSSFYAAVNANTVQTFFETHNWGAIFPSFIGNSAILSEIAAYNYSVIVSSDGSIIFVRSVEAGLTDGNVIFVVKAPPSLANPCY